MFPTTAWSLLEDAKGCDRGDHLAAMNRFIVGYWRPIYLYVRVRGHPHESAEDLTQEFLWRFLERGWIARADAARGRFRNFLLTVLNRFLADQAPGRAPRQRGFECSLVPVSTLIKDEERTFEPPHHQPPEEIFMRQWALALIEDVRRELEIWCRQRGRPDWYQIFTAHHFPGPGQSHMGHVPLAERFRCSVDQVRYALGQTNEQFARLLRAAVGNQVASEEEIDAEIRDIERLVSQ